MVGSLANFDLANFLSRELWARRTRGQPGPRQVRVGNRRKRQRGSRERPMNSEAWTSHAVPSPAALWLVNLWRVAKVVETLRVEKQKVGVLNRPVQPVRRLPPNQMMRTSHSAQRMRADRKARRRNCLGLPRWGAWVSWETTQSTDRVRRGACPRALNQSSDLSNRSDCREPQGCWEFLRERPLADWWPAIWPGRTPR